MIFQKSVELLFGQLSTLLKELPKEEYQVQSQHLFDSSIGKHVRHIIEMFRCLEEGYESGIVNYEKRKRDETIERDPELASQQLARILSRLKKRDKPLVLETEMAGEMDITERIGTSFYRELVYNTEHCIHHMAIIRMALRDSPYARMSDDFGVAFATIKHRRQCAP